MPTELAITCESEKYYDDFIKVAERITIARAQALPDIKPYYSMKEVYRFISSLTPKDILYVRYPPIPKITVPILLNNRAQTIFELNGIPSKETGERAPINPFWRAMEELIGPLILSRGDGIVGVTDEISRHYLARIRRDDIKNISISNGIACADIPLRNYSPILERQIHLIGVGFVSNWHGFDRIIKGISDYKGDRKYIFHIIGDGPEIAVLKRLVNNLELENNVIFHGFQAGETLNKLYSVCDVAVSTLAIHRKGLTNHCSLKSREYCARGIPFIYAGNDPDFINDFEFALQAPMGDEPIQMEIVGKFYDRLMTRSSYPIQMRNYAESNLDWDVKWLGMLSFIDNILKDTPIITTEIVR